MSVQVVINTAAFEASVTRQVGQMMMEALTEMTAIIGEQADQPKTGRQYRGRRRASAPGETPARQTSALVDSITDPDVQKEGRFLVGQIRITAPHTILLQRGTDRIKPRPIAQPAVDEFLRRRG